MTDFNVSDLKMIIYPNCAVFSTSEDVHTVAVIAKMSEGTIPFICNFSRFGQEYTGMLSENGELVLFLKNGTEVRFDHLSTVWWRRPQHFPDQPKNDMALAAYVQEENSRFWDSALSVLTCKSNVAWYNDPDKNRTADRKTFQLLKAQNAGFKVPRTLVMSDYTEAARFCSENAETIFKSYAGSEYFWQPTRKFDRSMLDYFSSLHVCPVIFQEFIEEKYDYRITVIDDNIFSVRFDLQNTRYKYDVRIDTKNKAEKCSIPRQIENRVMKFMKLMGLRYGSVDLREQVNGDFVFFEVNPAGQFLYLDILAKTEIATCMANALSMGKGHVIDSHVKNRNIKFDDNCRPFAEILKQRIFHLE